MTRDKKRRMWLQLGVKADIIFAFVAEVLHVLCIIR